MSSNVEHRFELIQTLLLRNGVEEMLLTKRSYPDASHFYALSLGVKGETCEFLSIPVSLKRVAQIRAGELTLRAAFTQPETAFWYRCKLAGGELSSGDTERTQFPAEHLPDDVTLDVALGRAPARVVASDAAVERILTAPSATVPPARRRASRKTVDTEATPVGVTTPRPRKIDSAVLAVLSQASTEGNLLRLTGQLDRKMYEAVNQILDEAGGKWKGGKTKAHVFDGEAAEIIEPILLTGEIARRADFGFFPTPLQVVENFIIPRLRVTADSHALEPEAGVGGIALPIAKICRVDCIELQEKNVKALQDANVFARVLQGDFLSMNPADFPKYDAVVMNPPFAKQADIKHVLHASRFVKDGGQLLAIMSAGVAFRTDKLTKKFNDFVASQGGWTVGLPEASFVESGTSVNTVLAEMTINGQELVLAVGDGPSR
jgi:predicted RNA methylase